MKYIMSILLIIFFGCSTNSDKSKSCMVECLKSIELNLKALDFTDKQIKYVNKDEVCKSLCKRQ